MESRSVRIEELLAHAGWVRDLASRLVRDPASADDVTQEVWARALSSPPRERTNLRGWLAATVRTTARTFQRRQSRRDEHELRATGEREEPSAAELVERAQLHRRLVVEVLALPEEQRGIVLAHWFEGRSITSIAERRSLTSRVAKARLDEAHEELRRRLDAADGGRSAWLAAFSAWTHPPAVVATGSGVLIGGLAMGTKAKLTVLAAAALLLWLGLRERSMSPEPSPTKVVNARTEELDLDSSSAVRVPRAQAANAASVLDAQLVVHVRDAWTRLPLQGARVSVSYFPDPRVLVDQRLTPDQVRELTRERTTTGSGDEALDIPAGIPLVVSALHDDCTDGGVGDQLTALTAGERRELTLEMHVAPDVHFFARVLDRAENRPIAGALATLALNPTLKQRNEDPSRRLVSVTEDAGRSDATGLLEITAGSWRLQHMRVEASGFTPAFVFPQGRSTVDDPLVLLLERANSVECRVVDVVGAPVPGVEVTLDGDAQALFQPAGAGVPSGRLRPGARWTGTTDVDGACIIQDLPNGMTLRPTLAKPGVSARGTRDPFVLEPGDRRKLVWQFEAMCALSGRVLDNEGKPVAGVALWLLCVSDDPISPPETSRRYFPALTSKSIHSRTTSDAEGRFRFDEIAPGRIWVGPACAEDRRVTPGTLAPIVDELVIPETALVVEHDIHVEPARYVRGRVVDTAGRPIRTGVHMGGDERAASLWYTSDNDGAFVAGPVSEGEFWIQADGATGCCESEPIHVRAGALDVVLQLCPGARLGASLVDDESGSSCLGQIQVFERKNFAMGRFQNDSRDPARFELSGVRPGLYDVVGKTSDGRVGLVRAVTLDPRAPVELVVRVARGAKLRLKCEGKHGWGTFVVHCGEADLVRGSVTRGAGVSEYVIPGHLVIDYWPHDTGEPQRRDIDIQAGEEQDVVFRDDG